MVKINKTLLMKILKIDKKNNLYLNKIKFVTIQVLINKFCINCKNLIHLHLQITKI